MLDVARDSHKADAGNGVITPRFRDIRAVQRPVRWLKAGRATLLLGLAAMLRTRSWPWVNDFQ